MNNDDETRRGAVLEEAIYILRQEYFTAPGTAPVAVSMWQLVSELEESGNAPTTAVGVLDLIAGLIADPRVDLVNEFDTGLPMIEFAWAGAPAPDAQSGPGPPVATPR